MFNTYFGDVTSGRLLRLPFIGYFILLQVVIFALMMGAAASLGIAESLIGGNLQETQAMLLKNLGTPVLITMAIFALLFIFAALNLKAKRIRDMGLPGWWTLLAVWIISAVVLVIVNVVTGSDPLLFNSISSAISTIGVLALIFIPSDTFSGNNS